MPYVLPDDFRTATLAEYAVGLALTDAEAADPLLTAAIERISRDRIDRYTNDHFEAEDDTSFFVRSRGSKRLYIPRRIRTIAEVEVRDAEGVFQTQDFASYRPVSSFDDGQILVARENDYIEIVENRTLSSGACEWPSGDRLVKVTGNFGWAETPADIKRATCLLVYDHFKPVNANIRKASRWSTADAVYMASVSEPTGILEVDQILAGYHRPASIVAR